MTFKIISRTRCRSFNFSMREQDNEEKWTYAVGFPVMLNEGGGGVGYYWSFDMMIDLMHRTLYDDVRNGLAGNVHDADCR